MLISPKYLKCIGKMKTFSHFICEAKKSKKSRKSKQDDYEGRYKAKLEKAKKSTSKERRGDEGLERAYKSASQNAQNFHDNQKAAHIKRKRERDYDYERSNAQSDSHEPSRERELPSLDSPKRKKESTPEKKKEVVKKFQAAVANKPKRKKSVFIGPKPTMTRVEFPRGEEED